MNPFESDINASILMNPYSVVAFTVHDRNVPFHSIEIPPPPLPPKMKSWSGLGTLSFEYSRISPHPMKNWSEFGRHFEYCVPKNTPHPPPPPEN